MVPASRVRLKLPGLSLGKSLKSLNGKLLLLCESSSSLALNSILILSSLMVTNQQPSVARPLFRFTLCSFRFCACMEGPLKSDTNKARIKKYLGVLWRFDFLLAIKTFLEVTNRGK